MVRLITRALFNVNNSNINVNVSSTAATTGALTILAHSNRLWFLGVCGVKTSGD